MKRTTNLEESVEKHETRLYQDLLFKLLRRGTICFALYVGLLGTGYHISRSSSSELHSQQEAEFIVEREREILGIDSNVKIRLVFDADISKAKRINKNEYEIRLRPTDGKYYKSTLVHELAHIGHDDCDNITLRPSLKNGLMYFFWKEPRAILHSLN